MLYTNKRVEAEKRIFSWGEMSLIALGERGRGRYEIAIPCPEGLVLEKGENPYSIGLSQKGNPKIIPENGGYYLLLDTRWAYTRRGDGEIVIPESQKEKVAVIAKGNGADGAAGRIGQWDVKVLKLLDKCQLFCWLSGRGYDRLAHGVIYDYDPAFDGSKVREVSLREAPLYEGDFVPEILQIVQKETAQ